MNSVAHETCEIHTHVQRNREVQKSDGTPRCEEVSWRQHSVAGRAACVSVPPRTVSYIQNSVGPKRSLESQGQLPGHGPRSDTLSLQRQNPALKLGLRLHKV